MVFNDVTKHLHSYIFAKPVGDYRLWWQMLLNFNIIIFWTHWLGECEDVTRWSFLVCLSEWDQACESIFFSNTIGCFPLVYCGQEMNHGARSRSRTNMLLLNISDIPLANVVNTICQESFEGLIVVVWTWLKELIHFKGQYNLIPHELDISVHL